MDFLHNPIGNEGMKDFNIDDLEPEAAKYLKAAGAIQKLPIERLEHMNTPAIDIYRENGIDLYSEPLEIAVCAQHNNGGFAINKWWESNIKHTFIIGEMAGSHGIKRPGGSALNAGQVGSQRAAEFIANVYSPDVSRRINIDNDVKAVIKRLKKIKGKQSKLSPSQATGRIRETMTACGGHIRKFENAQKGIFTAVELLNYIEENGLAVKSKTEFIEAVQILHLSLASVAYLKAIIELLKANSGSRGSYLVLSDDGIEIHPDIKDPDTGRTLKFRPENKEHRKSIIRIVYDPLSENLFKCESISVRMAPADRKAFEPAWSDFREGKIYQS